MMRTQSELWLQQFFANRNVSLYRISETDEGRTPDYELDLFGQRVIVEVKELVPNADERASIEMSQRNGVGAVTREVIWNARRGHVLNRERKCNNRRQFTILSQR